MRLLNRASKPGDTVTIRGVSLPLAELVDRAFFQPERIEALRQRLQAAKPFPHLVIEGLFRPRLLELAAEEFDAINSAYRDALARDGMVFSGMSPDGLLPEIVERPDHPWFIGVQFHPELKSKPFDPHPLFAGFIGAALRQARLV